MSEVLRRRNVDENNEVVTVRGGRSQYRRQPCGGCPWRIDQTGSFPADAFLISAETSYDMSSRMFGCHESGTDNPSTCAGFLLRGACHNMAVRVRIARGQIDPRAITEDGQELYSDYRSMAVANGCDPADPRLRECR